ncbi:glycosyltransferase family 2 protein [Aurantiacibacter xanthus]|uniref:Glycosyltransferase family 2 protein n=1 Tax=Aurantiacibacter xanthus TaxID=1784712 RepID=A0A3A1P876_9SPHN|nr:glycosyltransferase family 2 protein [Aurantiacibacter xanthus]RIV89764.1 glycosyltransferase family 2 protein [Aurantiacibacter xanthus]
MTIPSDPSSQPDVSVAIACYNAMPYLAEAIDSALQQRGVSVEVLVVDDHGSDESFAYAQQRAAADSRVRVFQTPENQGPGGARNVAIEQMRGRWYAVLDSDDVLEPGRFAEMIALGERHHADMVADDLTIFGENVPTTRFLAGSGLSDGGVIDLDTYFRHGVMFGKLPNLGFLKPIIRASLFAGGKHRYRKDLRIGEDDELIVQLLLGGAEYRLLPLAGYRYRKHASSISHRLSLANARRILASERELRIDIERRGRLTPAYRQRFRSVEQAVAFTQAVEALKQRQIGSAITVLLGNPAAVRHFMMPLSALAGRWRKRLSGGAA